MKNSLFVHIVLDASGSMLAAKGPTLKACNDYIEALGDDTVVTVDIFSTRVSRLRDAVPKGQAKIRPEEYPCVGNTALYDATGGAIQSIDSKAAGFDRIALVIQTDGRENASREFTLDAIRTLLRDKQDGEGWLIVYLGANIAATTQFLAMGATPESTMTYDAALSGNAMQAVTRSTLSYSMAQSRYAGRAQAAFTDKERAKSK